MYTYLVMSLPFLGLVVLMDIFILKTKVMYRKETWLIMLAMFMLTAVFDQPIEAHFYKHDQAKTLHIELGYVPIEDFGYTIAAVIGIGALVEYGKTKKSSDAT